MIQRIYITPHWLYALLVVQPYRHTINYTDITTTTLRDDRRRTTSKELEDENINITNIFISHIIIISSEEYPIM